MYYILEHSFTCPVRIPLIAFVRGLRFYSYHAKLRLGLPAEQPLAVVARGWILDACKVAEADGVRGGIRCGLAKRRCAGLRVIEYDPAEYGDASFRFWSCFAAITPLVEPLDQAQGYLDLRGCVPRGGSLDELLTRTALGIYEHTGVLIDWAAGQDRWIARLACGENRWIDPAQEGRLLKRLRIERLGIASELCQRLHHYGIRTAADLLRTPRSFIEAHLQVPRAEIDPFLRRGDRIVREAFPPAEVVVELELAGGIDGELEQAIEELARRAEAELRSGERQAARLAVQLRGREATKHASITLAKPVAMRQGIAAQISTLISELRPQLARNIRLTCSQLSRRDERQNELWQSRHSNQQQERLAGAQQTLTRKFGMGTVRSGREYAERMPPRFAQMILERRGLFLP
jgi:nucleotidyltransferase/DNA polymerase involved in DNA repair